MDILTVPTFNVPTLAYMYIKVHLLYTKKLAATNE